MAVAPDDEDEAYFLTASYARTLDGGLTLTQLTGGQARLRILSNLADERLARASARIPFELLAEDDYSGREVAERLMEAWAFADADPYRATTHNKGIMNGIDALAFASSKEGVLGRVGT